MRPNDLRFLYNARETTPERFPVYVLYVMGRTVVPLFDSSLGAERFVTGHGPDRRNWHVGPPMPPEGIEGFAQDALRSGATDWSFNPPPSPKGVVYHSPLQDLVRQAALFKRTGKR